MDLQGLNIFIQVAELNSFTRAGEKLGYSQPTISFQIKQLEKELGVQLFDRIGHTVSLTEAGREALLYAQNICHMSQEMVLGAQKRYEVRGVVRLGMGDSLCTPLIARAFAGFRAAYPHISLQVISAGTGELFRLLDHNEVDVVCTLDKHIYDTTYVIVNEERIGVHFIVASEHPLAAKGTVTIEELIHQPFLLTEKGMSYRRLMDEKLASRSLEIQPILEIASAELICKMVESDFGVSFLPDYVTEEAVQKKKIVRLDVMDFEVEVWKQILHHRDKWMSEQINAVMEHMSGILLN